MRFNDWDGNGVIDPSDIGIAVTYDNVPERETKYVVGAIILNGRRILATQRGYGDYQGWWEFPGGKIEDGATPEIALEREIKEELNAEITDIRYFDVTEYDYEKFYLVMKCYLCSLVDGQFELLEHMGSKWLARDDINSVQWLAADLPIVEKLLRDEII
jgi:8-oxo-dGTP diphosphatase